MEGKIYIRNIITGTVIGAILVIGIYFGYTYIKSTSEDPNQVLDVYGEHKNQYTDCMTNAEDQYGQDTYEYGQAINGCQIKYPRNYIENVNDQTNQANQNNNQ